MNVSNKSKGISPDAKKKIVLKLLREGISVRSYFNSKLKKVAYSFKTADEFDDLFIITQHGTFFDRKIQMARMGNEDKLCGPCAIGLKQNNPGLGPCLYAFVFYDNTAVGDFKRNATVTIYETYGKTLVWKRTYGSYVEHTTRK
jgi:hypothetical protein